MNLLTFCLYSIFILFKFKSSIIFNGEQSKINPIYPTGHVCVAHLFAGLIDEMDATVGLERINIAASLLLVSIRFYLHVFNRWWVEGQFKDWCSEFLIEKW